MGHPMHKAERRRPAAKVIVKCAGKCGRYVTAEYVNPNRITDLPTAYCPDCKDKEQEHTYLATLTLPA